MIFRSNLRNSRLIAIVLIFGALTLTLILGEPVIAREYYIVQQNSQDGINNKQAGNIEVLASNSSEFVFEIRPPQLLIEETMTEGGLYSRTTIPGYSNLGEPGWPDLPQQTIYIALPPGTKPALVTLSDESQQLDGIQVLPASQTHLLNQDALLNQDISEFIPEFETRYQADGAGYSSDRWYPAGPVVLGETFWLRDHRVTPVHIRPVLANSYQQTLSVFSYIKVRISFEHDQQSEAFELETGPQGETFQSILSNTLANYEAAAGWQMKRPVTSQPQISPCMDENAFRIAVQETGMYELTYGELSAAGWPSGIQIDKLRMCHEDQEIAIRTIGSGIFDGSDRLIFYGQGIKTQETETNIYWLTYFTDGTLGQRMENAAAAGGGVTPTYYSAKSHLEIDAIWYSSMPMSDANDHWYWRTPLVGRDPDPDQSMDVDFSLPDPVDNGGTFPLRVMFWAFLRDEYHRVQVLFNGHPLAVIDFHGSGINNDYLLYEDNVSASFLDPDGSNTITVKALPHELNPPELPHRTLVDWIELEPFRQFKAIDNRLAFDLGPDGNLNKTIVASGFSAGAVVDIYDVTEAGDVNIEQKTAVGGTISFNRQIASTRAFELFSQNAYHSPVSITPDSLPSQLLSETNNQADMIIITDPSLNSALNPLRSLRSAQGLSVKTVYVQDIFDEFGYGLYSTEAIRDFLAFTSESWTLPKPQFVLLAGEGSYDHRDILGLNEPGGNLVPVYLRSGIDNSLGEAAADNQYVDFNGDDLADMLLGRLPARTHAELSLMVQKIIDYENGPVTAPWRARHLFVTDNGLIPFEGTCYQDPAADFFTEVDDFIDDNFPGEHLLYRQYYGPAACYPDPEPYYAATVGQMQTGIVEKYSSGNQYVVYTGHSGTRVWGHEQFFDVAMAGSISNGSRTPIMLPMTCLVGYYHDPSGNSLSETLLKSTTGGSVASYAPTGLQVQSGHRYLIEGFYEGVFSLNAQVIGEAVLKAKLNLATGPTSYQDLQDTYMLLGDPAMRIESPDNLDQSYLPLTVR